MEDNIKTICNEMTFNDYPVTFKMGPDNDVYVFCKGVLGTLSEGEEFLRHKSKKDGYTFGGRPIVQVDNMVQIDCLTDTKKQFKNIAKLAREFRDKENLKIKQK